MKLNLQMKGVEMKLSQEMLEFFYKACEELNNKDGKTDEDYKLLDAMYLVLSNY